jgi:hypothetical protein
VASAITFPCTSVFLPAMLNPSAQGPAEAVDAVNIAKQRSTHVLTFLSTRPDDIIDDLSSLCPVTNVELLAASVPFERSWQKPNSQQSIP